jgi:hypothetical protein
VIKSVELRAAIDHESFVRTGACRDRDYYALARTAHALTVTVAVVLAFFVSGCVNAEISAGRADLAKGDYAAAHEKFAAAAKVG